MKFAGFSQHTIDFLSNLALNNEKPWFDSHKSDYQTALYQPMKSLGEEIFTRFTKGHESYGLTPKLSRIYRDARYLRPGDGPYRTSMWVSVERPTDGEWTDQPVFWFDLSPETWSYGMGYGGAKASTMETFRATVAKDPKKFERLIAFLDNQTEFTLEGEDYKRPKPAPTDRLSPWFNKKSFSLIHRQAIDAELFSPTLPDRITTGMLSLLPLYDYLITIKQ